MKTSLVAMDSDDDDLDSHMCLLCNIHIIGLEKYVHHKRFECVARRQGPLTATVKQEVNDKLIKEEAPENTTLNVNVSQEVAPPVDSTVLTRGGSAAGQDSDNAAGKNKHSTQEVEAVGESRRTTRQVGRPREAPHSNTEELKSAISSKRLKQQTPRLRSPKRNDIQLKHEADEKQQKEKIPSLTTRSVGRPRKQTVAMTTNSEGSPHKQTVTKRGVGRPPKQSLPTPEQGHGGEMISTKRPVGRPPKRVLSLLHDGERSLSAPWITSPKRHKGEETNNTRLPGDVLEAKPSEDDIKHSIPAPRSRGRPPKCKNPVQNQRIRDGTVTAKRTHPKDAVIETKSSSRRTSHYDSTDLYKPRLSFGGSRRYARVHDDQLDITAKLIKTEENSESEYDSQDSDIKSFPSSQNKLISTTILRKKLKLHGMDGDTLMATERSKVTSKTRETPKTVDNFNDSRVSQEIVQKIKNDGGKLTMVVSSEATLSQDSVTQELKNRTVAAESEVKTSPTTAPSEPEAISAMLDFLCGLKLICAMLPHELNDPSSSTADNLPDLSQAPDTADNLPAPSQAPDTADNLPDPSQAPDTADNLPAPSQAPDTADNTPDPSQAPDTADNTPYPSQARGTADSPALLLIRLLNELNFPADYRYLDRLPEDCDTAVSDVTGREARDVQGYRILPHCLHCSLYFLNDLAYYAHLRSAEHTGDTQLTSAEQTVDTKPTSAEQTVDTKPTSAEHTVDTKPTSAEHTGDTQPMSAEHIFDTEIIDTGAIKTLMNAETGGVSLEPVMVGYSGTCPACNLVCDSKYVLACHLYSALRLDSVELVGFVDLVDLARPLKLYHCDLCLHYCDTIALFLDHLGTRRHNQNVDRLTGDMVCATCSFRSCSKKQTYLHYKMYHDVTETFREPHVLGESRENIQCQFCNDMLQSALRLHIHQDVTHGDQKHFHGNRWCYECDREFSTSSNLIQHIKRKHKKTSSFRCTVCDKSFSFSNNLDVHYMSKKHKMNVRNRGKLDDKLKSLSHETVDVKRGRGRPRKDKMIKTEIVDEDIQPKVEDDDTGDVVLTPPTRGRGRPKKCDTLLGQVPTIYKCDLCGYKYVKESRLKKHVLSQYHANTQEEANASSEMITCPTCERNFYSKKRYSLHRLSHAEKDKFGPDGAKGISRLKGIPEIYHKFVLQLPKSVVSEVQCPECKQWFKANTVLPHIRCKHNEGSELPYRCNFCPRSFSSNSSLYRHHKSHLGLQSFSCKICLKRFRSKSDVDSHEFTFHKELNIEPRFKCVQCGAGFMQQSKLNVHVRDRHEKVRKYWCAYAGCHRSFVHKQEFTVHTRGHTGEKPYLCNYCGFSTKTKVQLTRHERIHSNVAKYKCKHCSYCSRHGAGLRRHMRLHTGAKPYKCPHCDHRCYSHTNLRIHIRNSRHHPGLQLYNCKHCPYATNVTTTFQTHMYQTHGVRPEDIAHVAEYCGVYIPELDISAVVDGAKVIAVHERKPKAKTTVKVKQVTNLGRPEYCLVEDSTQQTVIVQGNEGDQAYMLDESQQEQFARKITAGLVGSGSRQYRLVPIDQPSNSAGMLIRSQGAPGVMMPPSGEEELVIIQASETHKHDDDDTTIMLQKAEPIIVIQGDSNHQQQATVSGQPAGQVIMPEASDGQIASGQPAGQVLLSGAPEEQVMTHPETDEENKTQQENHDETEEVVTMETGNQVYLTSDGTELKDLIQGLEDTGAVVELRMEDEFNVPDGQPGDVIQMMGPDNQPIQFFYV